MTIQKIKNIYHLVRAIIATIVYGNPSKKIQVIGVTGTDGKTTTTALIYHILTKSGKKASMISTVSAVVGNKSYDTGFHVTTPSPFSVQRYLHEAVEQGDEYFVLETTSHALDQGRVFGVDFRIGLITNITHEHLLYHGTYDEYVKSKTKLIKWAHKGIINNDDISYEHILKNVDDISKILTYGLKNKSDYMQDIEKSINSKLAHFNKYNYLAAYAVCHELGIPDEAIFTAMKTYSLPVGRMEVVYDKEFKVIVDFAHTPNAVHQALFTLREQYPKNRILHIFGAAAFRDDSKRPLMGAESGRYADATIITEEDYRTEDPYKIAKEIGAGLIQEGFTGVDAESFSGKDKTFTTIVERQKAIDKAIQLVKHGDIVILTGKGHEQSLCRGTVEYPWDDKQGVLKSISAIVK